MVAGTVRGRTWYTTRAPQCWPEVQGNAAHLGYDDSPLFQGGLLPTQHSGAPQTESGGTNRSQPKSHAGDERPEPNWPGAYFSRNLPSAALHLLPFPRQHRTRLKT